MNILLEMLAVLGLFPREASQTYVRKRKGNEEKIELHKVGAQVPESSQWPRETIRGKGDVLMRSAAQPADDEAILCAQLRRPASFSSHIFMDTLVSWLSSACCTRIMPQLSTCPRGFAFCVAVLLHSPPAKRLNRAVEKQYRQLQEEERSARFSHKKESAPNLYLICQLRNQLILPCLDDPEFWDTLEMPPGTALLDLVTPKP